MKRRAGEQSQEGGCQMDGQRKKDCFTKQAIELSFSRIGVGVQRMPDARTREKQRRLKCISTLCSAVTAGSEQRPFKAFCLSCVRYSGTGRGASCYRKNTRTNNAKHSTLAALHTQLPACIHAANGTNRNANTPTGAGGRKDDIQKSKGLVVGRPTPHLSAQKLSL